MNKKKVIFIGGSSYSGSTFLDMMLSSGDNGFTAGEVSALFLLILPYQFRVWMRQSLLLEFVMAR